MCFSEVGPYRVTLVPTHARACRCPACPKTSATTAMTVQFWSRATRDLLRSFGWSIAALHRKNAATKLPFLAVRPIASLGRRPRGAPFVASLARLPARDKGAGADASVQLSFVIIIPLWPRSIGCSARGAQQMRFEALLEGLA
jgi:hypothetical protein